MIKEERDLSEIKIMERIIALHQRAVSGEQISGFFHDLMNSLTALNLAMEQVSQSDPGIMDNAKIQLEKAVMSSRRMVEFVNIIRRYNNPREPAVQYQLGSELKKIITLFDYRTNKSNVAIRLFFDGPAAVFGKPSDLYQIFNNLISHSIDNYGEPDDGALRYMDIIITGQERQRIIAIKDYSSNTATETNKKLCNLFDERAICNPESYLGLAIARRLIYQKLNGSLEITDNAGSSGITVQVQFETSLT